MKIDHMIFNSKKWYEGQMPCYVGKTIRASRSVTSYNLYQSTNTGFQSDGNDPIPNGKVLGQIQMGNSVFLMWHYRLLGNYEWFNLNELFQNGGVSASYIITLCSHRKELVA